MKIKFRKRGILTKYAAGLNINNSTSGGPSAFPYELGEALRKSRFAKSTQPATSLPISSLPKIKTPSATGMSKGLPSYLTEDEFSPNPKFDIGDIVNTKPLPPDAEPIRPKIPWTRKYLPEKIQPFVPSSFRDATRAAQSTAKTISGLGTFLTAGAAYLPSQLSRILVAPALQFSAIRNNQRLTSRQAWEASGEIPKRIAEYMRAGYQDVVNPFINPEINGQYSNIGPHNKVDPLIERDTELLRKDLGPVAAATFSTLVAPTMKAGPALLTPETATAAGINAVNEQVTSVGGEQTTAEDLQRRASDLFIQSYDLPENSPERRKMVFQGASNALDSFKIRYNNPEINWQNIDAVQKDYIDAASNAVKAFSNGDIGEKELAEALQPAVELAFISYAAKTGVDPYSFISAAASDGFDVEDLNRALKLTGRKPIAVPTGMMPIPGPEVAAPEGETPAPGTTAPNTAPAATGGATEGANAPAGEAATTAGPEGGAATEGDSEVPPEEGGFNFGSLINEFQNLSGPEKALLAIGLPLTVIGGFKALFGDDTLSGLLLLLSGLFFGGIGGAPILSKLLSGGFSASATPNSASNANSQPTTNAAQNPPAPNAPQNPPPAAAQNPPQPNQSDVPEQPNRPPAPGQNTQLPPVQQASMELDKDVEQVIKGQLSPNDLLAKYPPKVIARYALSKPRDVAVKIMAQLASKSQEYLNQLKEMANLSLGDVPLYPYDAASFAAKIGISVPEADELIRRARITVRNFATA